MTRREGPYPGGARPGTGDDPSAVAPMARQEASDEAEDGERTPAGPRRGGAGVSAARDNAEGRWSLNRIVERAEQAACRERVAVGDLVDAFGRASFVPLLLVPALIVVTPLSGIPGLSGLCGITIALIATQWLVGRDSVWLPGWIMRREVSGRRMRAALARIRPFARWLDRNTRARLGFLFRGPFRFLPPLACALFGAMMPFLELVPFSSSLLGTGVTLLAFSMLTRDGLFALTALLPAAAAILVIAKVVG